ncbi:hypothetical protein VUR80DRAFT_5906 [Thermomyces stellatus]
MDSPTRGAKARVSSLPRPLPTGSIPGCMMPEPSSAGSSTTASASPSGEDCPICFDALDPPATANPCLHTYHPNCLLQWLGMNPSCPLCKATVTTVTLRRRVIYAAEHKPARPNPLSLWGRPAPRRRRRRSPSPPARSLESYPRYRLDVYRRSLFSLHVGANPHTGYRALTPAILDDPSHLSRARSFVRRELLVLDAFDPSLPQPDFLRPSSPQRSRAFRLEYIIAVLKAAGLQGASGAAEELLRTYLGGYTRLFLHELRAFLRSPYGRLEEWDRAVRYGPPLR